MFIKQGEAQLYSVDFGSAARTIVALGGWVGSWELWTEPFSILSKTWRSIGYDHRGTGASICPIEQITLDNMVDDVFAVLDAYGIDQCVLAAESMGAITAFKAVLKQQERFQGLVIVDGMFSFPAPEPNDPFMYGLRHQHEATMGQFVDLCVPEPNKEAERRWGRQIVMRSPQAAAIRLHEAMHGVDLSAQVTQIGLPTLIIHGEWDKIVPVDAGRWMAANLAHAKLDLLAETGHVPTVTRPKQVADAINRFFDPIAL